jgi:hypothetical protein
VGSVRATRGGGGDRAAAGPCSRKARHDAFDTRGTIRSRLSAGKNASFPSSRRRALARSGRPRSPPRCSAGTGRGSSLSFSAPLRPRRPRRPRHGGGHPNPPAARGARNMATQPASQAPAAMPASWPLYLPNLVFDGQDRRALLVDELLRALSGHEGWQLVRRLRAYLPQASARAWAAGAGRRRRPGRLSASAARCTVACDRPSAGACAARRGGCAVDDCGAHPRAHPCSRPHPASRPATFSPAATPGVRASRGL